MKNSESVTQTRNVTKLYPQGVSSCFAHEKSVLLIENHTPKKTSFKSYLKSENFMVIKAMVNQNLITEVVNNQPDIVVINMPFLALNAADISRSIRKVFQGPILVLATDNNEQAQIEAFKAGVDDYLIQPVTPSILKVRLDALYRRQPTQSKVDNKSKIQVGDITLYPHTQQCHVKNQGVHLSTFEFKLLGLLLTNVGKIMSRDSIYMRLLGREYNGEERTVDVRMSKLRDKLSSLGVEETKIETVWGRGYILNEVTHNNEILVAH